MVLARLLQSAEPEEGCALLLGRRAGVALELLESWPCLNRWRPAEERRRRFRLDPREQLLAQPWARARGLQVIGAAHSHPEGAAEPSATDLALCWGPSLMLIRSGLGRSGAGPASTDTLGLRAWWIAGEEGGAPLELPIMVSEPGPPGGPAAPPAGGGTSGLGE